ncbi:MAG: pyridoxamine 5-phosphate oxidase [Pseudomonadota bacterium]|jgi:pyridoxamine 5'-phosphate oxidase
MSTLESIRKDYCQASLELSDVSPNPKDQLAAWLEQAVAAKCPEPNAMSLSTVSPRGRPTSRVVLIRGIDSEGGLAFFTNYQSSKGQALAANPWASLLFFWPELERQVRIEGRVEKLSAAESDRYYQSRPLGNRLGAWASPQSSVIPSAQWLMERQGQFSQALGEAPPRPAHWGGYRLLPDLYEFWQGRPSRLHDRIRYQAPDSSHSGWVIERLAP